MLDPEPYWYQIGEGGHFLLHWAVLLPHWALSMVNNFTMLSESLCFHYFFVSFILLYLQRERPSSTEHRHVWNIICLTGAAEVQNRQNSTHLPRSLVTWFSARSEKLKVNQRCACAGDRALWEVWLWTHRYTVPGKWSVLLTNSWIPAVTACLTLLSVTGLSV